MSEPTKNLCAQIPESLHAKIRTRQESSGQTLSQYMTTLIQTYYEMEENKNMQKEETRPVAFQVPASLFDELKDYLKRNHVTQKDFFIGCIQRALADET